MKITKKQLRRVIRERLKRSLTEGFLAGYDDEQRQRLDNSYEETYAFVIGDSSLFYKLVDEHGWPEDLDTINHDWITFEDGFKHEPQGREDEDYEPYSKMGREYRRRKRDW